MRLSRDHGLRVATGLLLAATAMISDGRAAERSVLPFVEDDYPRALAEARARKLPIFADVWTAW